MSFGIWLAFVLASTMLLVVPGPAMTLVSSYAQADGRRTALFTVPGVALGDLAAMSLAVLAVSSLHAASDALFTAVKLAGAAYLVWHGVTMWLASPTRTEAGARGVARTHGAMFLRAFATACSPRRLLFLAAFVPQFITAATPPADQLAPLVPTFAALALLHAAAHAMAVGRRPAPPPARRPAYRLWLDRVGGGMLVGAGAAVAAWRRAS